MGIVEERIVGEGWEWRFGEFTLAESSLSLARRKCSQKSRPAEILERNDFWTRLTAFGASASNLPNPHLSRTSPAAASLLLDFPIEPPQLSILVLCLGCYRSTASSLQDLRSSSVIQVTTTTTIPRQLSTTTPPFGRSQSYTRSNIYQHIYIQPTMSEVTFCKTYLSALDGRPVKLSSDHIADARQYPSGAVVRIPQSEPRPSHPPTRSSD